jgi:hypothetical protein
MIGEGLLSAGAGAGADREKMAVKRAKIDHKISTYSHKSIKTFDSNHIKARLMHHGDSLRHRRDTFTSISLENHLWYSFLTPLVSIEERGGGGLLLEEKRN